MHDTMTLLNELATKFPLDWLIASGVLSPVLLALKKWRLVKNAETMLSKGWAMYSLVVLSAAAVAITDYIIHTPSDDPSIIAVQTAIMAFASQPVYFFIVKPALALIKKQIDRAVQLNLDIKSAAVSPPQTSAMDESVEVQQFTK